MEPAAFGYAPSLIGQSPHHAIVAAHEVIDELATQRRDEWLRLAETLAENTCPAKGGARLRCGIAVHGNQGCADRDLKCEFPPIPFGAFRKRLQCFQPAGQMSDRFEVGRAFGRALAGF